MRKLILLSAVFLVGCASRSEDIAPAYVSPIQYDSYTCAQLQEEAARISAKVVEVSGTQNNKATGDAVATGVGLIVFWPSVFFLKGNGETAGQLANLKGQMEAVEQESIKKKCGIEFRKR
jgi:hypothetical protein